MLAQSDVELGSDVKFNDFSNFVIWKNIFWGFES